VHDKTLNHPSLPAIHTLREKFFNPRRFAWSGFELLYPRSGPKLFGLGFKNFSSLPLLNLSALLPPKSFLNPAQLLRPGGLKIGAPKIPKFPTGFPLTPSNSRPLAGALPISQFLKSVPIHPSRPLAGPPTLRPLAGGLRGLLFSELNLVPQPAGGRRLRGLYFLFLNMKGAGPEPPMRGADRLWTYMMK